MVMILSLNHMSNTLILAIETSTPICSVSIFNNTEVIASIEGSEPNMHATALTVFIQKVLEQSNINKSDLQAISVSMGPGSYTGLRIGVSVAKGLCYALNIPLIAINTLDAIVAGYTSQNADLAENALLCPMIDARRQEVYTGFYKFDGENIESTKALIVDQDSFNQYVESGYQVKLFGSGADKFQELFKESSVVNITPEFNTKASFQHQIAVEKYKNNNFEDVAYFEPYYLKDFIVTTSKKNPLL